MVAHTKVFVGSLPQGSKPEELRKLFEGFGVVTECTVMNRCGFVHMQTEEQAAAAIRDLNNSTFNGGVIHVEKGKIKERGGGRGGTWGPMRGSVTRGGMRGGPPRGAPYPPVRGRGRGRPMRGPMGRGMAVRNGRGYNRGTNRTPMRGQYNPKFHPYGVPDSRGFTLMEPPDPFPPMYTSHRQAYGADDFSDVHTCNRRASMYHDDVMAPTSSSDLHARRAEPTMHAPAAAPGSYPYAQFPPTGRGGGGAARH